jgi:alpha-tubulin suppressor-like RCC1 family protein
MAWRDAAVMLGAAAAIGCGTLVGAPDESSGGGRSDGGAPPAPPPASPADDSGSSNCTNAAPTSRPPSPVTAIAAGDHHACALLADGSLRCWGDNSKGQLGNGQQAGIEPKPVTVAGITGITSVALGGGHSCAIAAGGDLYCWGSNDRGQLGLGGTTTKTSPEKVGFTARQVTLGDKHTCAIGTDNRVSCWGEGDNGRLGNGSVSDSDVPVPVSNLSNASTIAAGWSHACAVVAGEVSCWGGNGGGQLGTGDTSNAHTPAAVNGITDAQALALGRRYTCVLRASGELSCWGLNDVGQLASNGTDARTTPAPAATTLGKTSQLAAGTDFACQIGLAGTVRCWGDNDKGQLGRGLPAAEGAHPDPSALVPSHCAKALALAGGDDGKFGCAVLTNGEVSCWGENDEGELGNGTTTDSDSPTIVQWN